ncbi:HEAT domain containing protein [Halorubrum distributum JCM 9100]|uniref:HEAT domain containing protein n=4 Tax=Halorubrum distributum TaxID=29283 RepID=M0ENS0_9EURY|nr:MULTISPECIES: HEAT repeat domain-containing protein [Halorubrum distributum group]ELZ49436.1 HEAT domain containing protein [Halorubrum distributum JCM 9100]ELZ57330.1 HEAT domain containing protein [Halorubrum distributum JCM 10118]EMA59062.1 HEAT domain containing protein [Halorubrum litoreum JCM 13561]MDV7350816.1 HEAT repeat domain-containing protein [Halorubrum distributum]MYL67258.1 HEAT repeat domain-containing protein [Halorubrum terrestre]
MSLYQHARDGNAERLRDALGSDSAAVRRRAAEFLGEIGEEGDQPTIDGLLRAATTDDDPEVRGAAVDALDEIGEAALEQLLEELTGGGGDSEAEWVTARKFARALEADRPELRMAAANALGRLDDASGLQPLVGALDDEDPRVRLRAAQACGTFADARAVPGLRERLDDEEPRVRRAAANALGTIGTDQALSPLLDLLDDGDESIRRIAAGALGKASTPEPVEPLARALGDESAVVRNAAVYSVIELLSNVPTQQSHAVRDQVVSELKAADDATVVEPLVEILTDGQQSRQRRNAAWILGRVADPDAATAVEALADALADDDPQTAQFAATSLKSLGGPVVEDRLLDKLGPEHPEDARAKAVFVLGQIGGQETLNRLEEYADDDSQAVRKRVFSAVSKLRAGGP